MAIEAPFSKYKKNNLKIFMAFLIAFAMWFAYDGYFSESFKKKHTNSDGVPDSKLVFNQQAPFYLAGAAVVLAVYFWRIKDKKIVTGEDGLVLASGEKIAYDSIEKIDKTHFKSKGHFIITYKNSVDKEVACKLSSRHYDDLSAVLDEVVAKIS